jgi:uncharacterized surface anchored protein
LVFGSYSVKETAAPAGYKINDTTTHTVNVNVNTTCAGSPQSLSFVDTPLTDILAKADSQAVGGTKSQITCKQGTTTIGSSQNVEHAQVEVKDLEPGTYVCTIVVDP